MAKSHEEWLRQADYDMDTAEYLLKSGSNIYAVFMCYSSVEKALKGLYRFTLGRIPPRTTNLIALLDRTNIKPSEGIFRFLVKLNSTYPTTLYPEDLAVAQERYTERVARGYLERGKQTLEWLKAQS